MIEPVLFGALFALIGYLCGKRWPIQTVAVELAVIVLILWGEKIHRLCYPPVPFISFGSERITAKDLNAEWDTYVK